eukprot:3297591-Amphidinium_carterae.1
MERQARIAIRQILILDRSVLPVAKSDCGKRRCLVSRIGVTLLECCQERRWMDRQNQKGRKKCSRLQTV